MAGIGFELRKLMGRGGIFGTVQAYTYAAIISSGPWVLSIIGILIIGLLNVDQAHPDTMISQFQVSITYIIASSLVLTGFVQLAFTRYTADLQFFQDDESILPNFNGLLITVTVVFGLLGGALAPLLFPAQSLGYRALMAGGFVIMSNIWLTAIFMSGMKKYKTILFMFALGYGISVLLTLFLRHSSLEAILGGFLAGQLVLLLGLCILVDLEYPSRRYLSFSFLPRLTLYPSLIFIGFFYNAGVWIDKFIFWSNPYTSIGVIGSLRSSPIYDIPVFLAYLAIIPGMAVFLVKLETDFVEYHEKFYDAVRSGQDLQHIEDMRNAMVRMLRQGIFQIFAVQVITVNIVFLAGSHLLTWLGISDLYLPLLSVNVIATAIQVIFLGILTAFFYLDNRREALALTLLFFVLNGLFTTASLWLGPKFYGFGFAAALVIVVALGFHLLDRKLETLEFDTFMLR
jgi:uncharacterized membrane protein